LDDTRYRLVSCPNSDGDFAIKKISVLSGMAALRMATYYGMHYSYLLFTETACKTLKDANKIDFIPWAPYFELYHQLEALKFKNGQNVLLFDGAPNPINIPEMQDKIKKLKVGDNFGAIIIDSTNLTSWEKASYLSKFKKYLAANPDPNESFGGVLLMIDSASKHPTGGDLVHGVMRVCGNPASVEKFFELFLFKHIERSEKFGDEFKNLTVLSEAETYARKAMKENRLVMGNKDFWRWFN
jgi:hypothetical protein